MITELSEDMILVLLFLAKAFLGTSFTCTENEDDKFTKERRLVI